MIIRRYLLIIIIMMNLLGKPSKSNTKDYTQHENNASEEFS